MPVNIPTRGELDNQIRKVHSDLKTALDNLGVLKAFIDGYTVEQLQAADGFNYTPSDTDNLKAFVAQHPGILANQSVADALTFGGRLAGINLVRR